MKRAPPLCSCGTKEKTCGVWHLGLPTWVLPPVGLCSIGCTHPFSAATCHLPSWEQGLKTKRVPPRPLLPFSPSSKLYPALVYVLVCTCVCTCVCAYLCMNGMFCGIFFWHLVLHSFLVNFCNFLLSTHFLPESFSSQILLKPLFF